MANSKANFLIALMDELPSFVCNCGGITFSLPQSIAETKEIFDNDAFDTPTIVCVAGTARKAGSSGIVMASFSDHPLVAHPLMDHPLVAMLLLIH